MTWILLAVVAVIVAGGAMVAGLAVQARRQRADRLHVVPGVENAAPAAWAGAHTPEAKLHRRLGDAVRSMRVPPGMSSSLFDAQRVALEQEALRIDARLIAVAALAGSRREEGIAEVATLVDRYEAAVGDLVIASLDDSTSLDAVISESELRLRALQAARAEVEQADRPPAG